MPDSSAISTFHRWAWMESIERNMANLRAGIRIQKKALIGAQKIKSKQKCFQLPNRPPLQVKVRKINSAKKRVIVDKRRLPRFQDSSSSLCARSMARHVPEVHCLHDYESKGGCVVTLQAREGTVILRDQLTTWSFTLLRCTVTTCTRTRTHLPYLRHLWRHLSEQTRQRCCRRGEWMVFRSLTSAPKSSRWWTNGWSWTR